jgi:hypothetical protein
LLIGKIGKRPAGLELIEAADSLLVLTPLRRIRAFARPLRRMKRTGGEDEAGQRQSGTVDS